MVNYKKIIELETVLRDVLSEAKIKENSFLLLKLCEGGWLPFKEAFALQKIFKEEKTFF